MASSLKGIRKKGNPDYTFKVVNGRKVYYKIGDDTATHSRVHGMADIVPTLDDDVEEPVIDSVDAAYSFMSGRLHRTCYEGSGSDTERAYWASDIGLRILGEKNRYSSVMGFEKNHDAEDLNNALQDREALEAGDITLDEGKPIPDRNPDLIAGELADAQSLRSYGIFPPDQKRSDQEALLAHSAQWMKNLSTEEQFAVYFMTSNGSSVLDAHVNDYAHDTWGEKIYPKEYLDSIMGDLTSALRKAPEVENPYISYRGVPVEMSPEKIAETYVTGQKYSQSRPESATLNPDRAFNFRDSGSSSVIIEIKNKTIASPVVVSAWGVSESEVFVNPIKEYRIVSVSTPQVEFFGYGNRRYQEKGVSIVQIEEL